MGSGDVFSDMGFDHAESQVLAVKADLCILILKAVRAKRLTQKDLAAIWHKPQPRVSEVLTGKVSLFSVDTLLGLLEALDVRVRVVPDKASKIA